LAITLGGRRGRIGAVASLKWDPTDFDNVVRVLANAPDLALNAIAYAAETMGGLTGLGGLSCPSPPWDPGTKHRVGVDVQRRPEIQKLGADGQWAPAPTTAPK
jgi:hypothetical protein